MTISKIRALGFLLPAGLLLASCTSYAPNEPEAGASVAPVQITKEDCKAMMQKMHEKMETEGMDMAAMQAKIKSGEGMSEQQKQCHNMMHGKMQKGMMDGESDEAKPGHKH